MRKIVFDFDFINVFPGESGRSSLPNSVKWCVNSIYNIRFYMPKGMKRIVCMLVGGYEYLCDWEEEKFVDNVAYHTI